MNYKYKSPINGAEYLVKDLGGWGEGTTYVKVVAVIRAEWMPTARPIGDEFQVDASRLHADPNDMMKDLL